MARTDDKLFAALLDLQNDPLDPDVPEEILDAMIQAGGGDPDMLADHTRSLLEAEAERLRLDWQEHAKRRRERLTQRAGAGRKSRQGMTTRELLTEIDSLKSDRKLRQPIALAARKRQPGKEPDANELRMLLEDLDQLKALGTDDSDDGDR